MTSVQLTVTDLKAPVLIDGKEYYLAPKNELKEMVEKFVRAEIERDTYKADVLICKNVLVSVLRIMGLLDEQTGTMKAGIQDGTESYFPYILKSLNRIIGMVTMAKFSKKSEQDLANEFAFIKTLGPLIERYKDVPQTTEAPKQIDGPGSTE